MRTSRAQRPGHAAIGATAIVLAITLVAGCDRKPEAPGAAPGTAGAAPAGAVGVSREEALNATYPSENTTSGSIRLVDGHYEDADLVDATLDDLEAAGDVDGDGTDDRVVVLSTSTGGSGIFHELYVLRRVQGRVVVSPPALLGDRVLVNDVKVERGEVVADLLVQGPEDPLCCPTQSATYRFRLVHDALTELTGTRAVFLKQ